MLNYKDFKPNDELHITSFNATPIKDVIYHHGSIQYD